MQSTTEKHKTPEMPHFCDKLTVSNARKQRCEILETLEKVLKIILKKSQKVKDKEFNPRCGEEFTKPIQDGQERC